MPERIDPLLLPFIDAVDEVEANRILERILKEDTSPIIDHVIAAFGRFPSPQDAQQLSELSGQVLVSLIARLRQFRADRTTKPIGSWRAYVATATRHACDEYLREKYPNRCRLKNRLRYLLTHQSGFALWEAAAGEPVCGLATWRERTDISSARYKGLFEDPDAISELRSDGLTANTLLPLLNGIFTWGGGPLSLDDLVGVVAHLCHVKDHPPVSTDDPHATSVATIDPGSDPSVRLAGREHLGRVWKEICELPIRQRAALMLNLADIALFPMTGVASIRQIAIALEWEPLEFARLWNRLPLADAAIAAELRVTRQQVVNLRKSARERLGRRMKAGV
jgi:hypothetical protein